MYAFIAKKIIFKAHLEPIAKLFNVFAICLLKGHLYDASANHLTDSCNGR